MIVKSLVSGSDPLPLKVFYSYSRADALNRDAIDASLAGFQWDVRVEPWYDGNIPPGEAWAEEIHSSLNGSDIILFFVTNHFMRSKYCQQVEVPLALRKHDEGKNRVIPIVFENTRPDWRKAPFARLQILPQNGKPVSEWSSRKEALDHISQALVNMIVDHGVKQRPRRRRWKLALAGERVSFTAADQLALVQYLRQVSGDANLRPNDMADGGITLVMESTDEALDELLKLYRGSQPFLVGRWQVVALFELYGAGVRASSIELPAGVEPPPQEAPLSDELLLFPSAPGHAVVLNKLSVKPKENDKFDLLFGFDDVGAEIEGRPLEQGVQKRLFDYFWTGIVARNEDVWVNLAPDERNRMLPEYLGGTNLGRVMIEMDYNMKRLCASLLHPDCETGQAYWKEVFRLAQERFGTSSVPYAPFFRVWLVPGEIVIKEGQGWMTIAEARLNALCESDFTPPGAAASAAQPAEPTAAICDEAFKKVVLPVVAREVQEGTNWIPIREVFSSLVVSSWCKARFEKTALFSEVMNTGSVEKLKQSHWMDSEPTFNNMAVPENKEYYDKYMEIFTRGVFYTVRDEYDPFCHRKVARVYFSGSIDFRGIGAQMRVIR